MHVLACMCIWLAFNDLKKPFRPKSSGTPGNGKGIPQPAAAEVDRAQRDLASCALGTVGTTMGCPPVQNAGCHLWGFSIMAVETPWIWLMVWWVKGFSLIFSLILGQMIHLDDFSQATWLAAVIFYIFQLTWWWCVCVCVWRVRTLPCDFLKYESISFYLYIGIYVWFKCYCACVWFVC